MAANAGEEWEKELDLIIERIAKCQIETDVHPSAAEPERALALPPHISHAEWAALMFDRMNSAADADDAVARAAALLEAFEVAAASRAKRERDDVAASQNAVLKKAVLVLHRRLNAQKAENRELQRRVDAHQERVAELESDKYALHVHLKQALQQGSSMPGYFNPGVF